MKADQLELSPQSPGYKGTDTSKAAAEEVKPTKAILQEACLICLLTGPQTADEIADFLELSVLSVRPRISELKLLGLIEDTGTRRKNISGKSAAVMRRV